MDSDKKTERGLTLKWAVLFLAPLLFFILIRGAAISDGYKTPRMEALEFIMDTYVRMILYPEGGDEERGRLLLQEAYAKARDLEKKLTFHHGESLTGLLNRTRHLSGISPDILQLFRYSADAGRQSGGTFSITLGRLVTLWKTTEVIPSEEQVFALARSAMETSLDIADDSITIKGDGDIDLGGVAKGWIVDRVSEFLIEQKAGSFLVDAGGDIRVYGRKPGGVPWKVAVRHPRGGPSLEMTLADGAVATSGDYERFVEIEGKRFHHLIDPETGFPSKTFMSATVFAPDLAAADAWATAIMAGFDPRKLQLPPGYRAIIYDNGQRMIRIPDEP